jgi:hypothetical protein
MISVKRIIPFVLFILMAFKGKADGFDEHCGIGVVDIAPYNFFSLDFYKRPGEIISDDEVYFFRDSIKPVLKYKFSSTGSDSIPAWFDPQLFVITKEQKKFQLYCVEKYGDWCRVITNKKLGITKWVELGFDVTFSEWQTFFVTVKNIEIIKGDSLLFDSPSNTAKTSPINLNYDHSYKQQMHCKEVQGMWMSVEIIELDEFGKVINKRTGWIKWRNDEQMLIVYYV